MPETIPYEVVVTIGSGLKTSTVVTPPVTKGNVVVLKSDPVQGVVMVVLPGAYTWTVLVPLPSVGKTVVVENVDPVQYDVMVAVL